MEVEVAFILGETLPGAGCTEDDVLRATEYVAPAIELIDSRIADWDIGFADTIADNASSAGLVLGPERVRPGASTCGRSRPCCIRTASRSPRAGPTPCSATRSPPLPGSPTRSPPFGVTLEAGHVVLPGSVHRAIDVRPGDEFVAEFQDFGSVHCFICIRWLRSERQRASRNHWLGKEPA